MQQGREALSHLLSNVEHGQLLHISFMLGMWGHNWMVNWNFGGTKKTGRSNGSEK
jgi:hypothetical protein